MVGGRMLSIERTVARVDGFENSLSNSNSRWCLRQGLPSLFLVYMSRACIVSDEVWMSSAALTTR
jgi:hypothetical protein